MKLWRCCECLLFASFAIVGPVKAADIQPPSIVFLYPTHQLVLATNWSSIHGIARDEPGGSGLERVEISMLGPDGRWWSGSNYVSEEVLLPTVLSEGTVWACNGGVPQGVNLEMGDYSIFAYAYDRAGNPGSASIRVRMNVPPPVSIELRAEGVAVMWPKWAESFGLESTSNMLIQSSWVSVTNQPMVQGETRLVILPV